MIPSIITFHKDAICCPLVFIHPAHGSAKVYNDFANFLHKDIPFFGIEHFNLYNSPKINTFHKLIDIYVKEIIKVTPSTKKIFLGGWSYGGLLAFEITQKLLQQGYDVLKIYILDSYYFKTTDWEENLRLANYVSLRNKENKASKYSKFQNLIDTIKLDNEFICKFLPKATSVPIMLFKANFCDALKMSQSEEEATMLNKTSLTELNNGWDHYNPNVETIRVDTDHLSMIKLPWIKNIAGDVSQDILKISSNL